MYSFSNNSTVCFFGDSITHNGGWIRRVYDYYRHELGLKPILYNCGVAGATAANALTRTDSTLFRFDPTDVVVFFGMNDVNYLLYADSVTTADDLKKRYDCIDRALSNIETICKMLFDRGIKVTVCTSTVYDDLTFSDTPACFGADGALGILSARLRDMVGNYGGHLVDFRTPMSEFNRKALIASTPIIKPDRVHPNRLGEELMARIFLNAQGFDVEMPQTVGRLIQLADIGHDDWEEKRYALEQTAKAPDFVKWCLYSRETDWEAIAEKARKEVENGTPYVELFEGYLNGYKDYENNISRLILHTEKVKDQ